MKLTFVGAGSTVFVKNIIGDLMLMKDLGAFEVALYDISEERLKVSETILKNLAGRLSADVRFTCHCGPEHRKDALRGAKYVFNAIQVGGYKPCTVTDFEIPKKYGLSQTIGDTMGIGGIFRALRSIPVVMDIVRDMEEVCPSAFFLNYANPMAMITGYVQRHSSIRTIGLCHSVQVCAYFLLKSLGMDEYAENCLWEIAGINHMAWLLKITDMQGNDLYPEIKRRYASDNGQYEIRHDRVRLDMMQRFGYYITESSEHNAEYHPYFLKSKYPELVERYNIPIDEYLRRCEVQIKEWDELMEKTLMGENLTHTPSREYGAKIVHAIETDTPIRVHGNVLNKNFITNLPFDACVEVPVMVDGNGFNPCYVGALPEQCACLNRTNINVQNLTIKAAESKKREDVYMAAYLDPHLCSELSLDDIKSLCDDMIEAHRGWIEIE